METKRNFKLIKSRKSELLPLYEDEVIPYWVEGLLDTPVGDVRVMKTELVKRDKLDGCKARWGINRDNYKVSPGLYAVGKPDSSSEVLVTANYKLTIDKLRVQLKGLNLWIVVLDTKGINVWCAAGKGTFGTTELIGRIRRVNLSSVVDHNRIILPQLAAPGVSAHVVTKMTGFKVIYGPIRSKDIHEFIDNGFIARDEMREVSFNLMDRLILIPIEIVHILKYVPMIYIAFFIINLIRPGKIDIGLSVVNAIFNALPYFLALFIGSFCIPLLLPYIPFKAFSLKGTLLGLMLSGFVFVAGDYFHYEKNVMIYLGNTFVLTAIVSMLSLNFTGSTTYTSLSGVKIETKWTTVVSLGAAVMGIILILLNLIMRFIG